MIDWITKRQGQEQLVSVKSVTPAARLSTYVVGLHPYSPKQCSDAMCLCLTVDRNSFGPTGHYGADCSLSLDDNGDPQLLAGQGYKARIKPPSIYVYELPPEMNTWWVLHSVVRISPSTYILNAGLCMGFH